MPPKPALFSKIWITFFEGKPVLLQKLSGSRDGQPVVSLPVVANEDPRSKARPHTSDDELSSVSSSASAGISPSGEPTKKKNRLTESTGCARICGALTLKCKRVGKRD